MRTKFRAKHFLKLLDFTPEEIMYFVDTAADLKRKWAMREPHEYLKGRCYAMIFEKKSTRTRTSFQAGMCSLGAQSIYMRPDEMQLSRGEPIRDTATILDRFFDGLFIRTFGQEIVEEFAAYMTNPVMNALTALAHPCQGLCDLLTIKEKFNVRGHNYKGLKICYAGDVYNVCQSLMVGAAAFGMDMYIARPDKREYDADPIVVEGVKPLAAASGAKIVFTDNFDEALKDADIVYGNTWHSMGENEEKAAQRVKDFMACGLSINNAALAKAKKDAIYMHCLPGFFGEDMTEEVHYGPQSMVFDQAENRMHTEKAVAVLTAF